MKSYREIEFTTTKIKGDLTAGKTCYQGQQVILDRDLPSTGYFNTEAQRFV